MQKKIKIGIFFGGASREREISFAGGRTVYDNLDKSIFEPIPIFVDSFNTFILLHWSYIYQGSIRDFYPPSLLLENNKFQLYIESLGKLSTLELKAIQHKVGIPLRAEELKEYIDVAFLVLHGPFGEDGTLQGLLDWYKIPYTGSNYLGASIGIDKLLQKSIMEQAGFPIIPYACITRKAWLTEQNKEILLAKLAMQLGMPLVVKSIRQGSSIGVSIVEKQEKEAFLKAVEGSFFMETVDAKTWKHLNKQEKAEWVSSLIDLLTGIGLPVCVHQKTIFQPTTLIQSLDTHFNSHSSSVLLESLWGESMVLVEKYILGREFSCIILQESGQEPIALPPTEILKKGMHFDYCAKYLPGLVRKKTPMEIQPTQLDHIQKACIKLFKLLHFQVYARIDGILASDGTIYLNDPNTTAGMNPSSFFFHQAAEVGLNPSQLLTFIIRHSLAERIANYAKDDFNHNLLTQLDNYLCVLNK